MFSPLANGLINLAEWLLKYVFNVRVDKLKEPFKRNDLKNLFQQNIDDERQERNTQLLENAQELPKVKIRQCLVPRKEIIGINSNATIEQVKSKFVETKLSKLVVFDNNIDHIMGYIHQLDLFKKPDSLQSILLPIPAVPESMSAADLISKFSRERKSIAWVVDEFGGTAGIITMEDVLEELFGEIQDEYDTEEFVEKQISENEYIFPAAWNWITWKKNMDLISLKMNQRPYPAISSISTKQYRARKNVSLSMTMSLILSA